MTRFKFLNFINFMAVAGLMSFPAHALEGPWAQGEFLKARIITENTATGHDDTLGAALEIVMEPDWHIYWRMPGDGGLPPMLDWAKSKNLKTAELQWPVPVRFEYEGLYGFGYKNAVTLPLVLTPEEKGNPLTLDIHADIMVCKTLCVPQKIDLTLDIPSGDAKPDIQAALIQDARETLPYTENRGDMKIENVVIGPKAIVVRAYLAQGFEGADLFAEVGPEMYIVAKPVITPDAKDPRYASIAIAAPEGVDNLASAVMNKTLVLTLRNAKGKALERTFNF